MRKVWCEVLEAAVYSDRCLYSLLKVIEGNKTCANCIVHEIEKMESEKSKRLGANDIKRINGIKGINDIKGIKNRRRRKNARCEKRPKPIKDGHAIQMYSSQILTKLLGKSERTVREWAQKGKIPAHKVGPKWRFNKEEIDRWLSRRKGDGCGIPHTKQSEEVPEPVNSPGSPSSSEDPLFCTIETKEG